MRFAYKYPDASDYDNFEEDYLLIHVAQVGPCFVCNQATSFFDIALQAYLCSEECWEVLWREVDYATGNLEEEEYGDGNEREEEEDEDGRGEEGGS